MMSTVTAAIMPNVNLRLRPEDGPRHEGGECDDDNGWNEPSGDLIGQSLDWRPAALGLGNELNDLCEHGVPPNLIRLDDERAGLVHRARDDAIARGLGHGHRFAGDHGLID